MKDKSKNKFYFMEMSNPFAPIFAQITTLLASMYQSADNMFVLYNLMPALDTLLDNLKDECDDQLARLVPIESSTT
jgi:hypothetical protein